MSVQVSFHRGFTRQNEDLFLKIRNRHTGRQLALRELYLNERGKFLPRKGFGIRGYYSKVEPIFFKEEQCASLLRT